MHLALTLWDNRVAPVFDFAASCLVLKKENDCLEALEQISLPEGSLSKRIGSLQAHKVELLLCGALSNEARRLLQFHDIEVIAFLSGSKETILQGLQSGDLINMAFALPGCGKPQHWHRKQGVLSMTIAFSTSGTTLDDLLESRFGRTPRFLILHQDTGEVEIVDNSSNQEASQGAGIQAAQSLVSKGVQVVITGHVGPKALQVLQAAGIQICETSPATLRDLSEAWAKGELESHS